MNNKGKVYEDIACKHLKKRGMTLLERNFNCRFGEIDLVMREGNTVIFIEVRYRSQHSHGNAMESIHAAKQKKIIKAASIYMTAKNLWGLDMRFDVVALSGERCGLFNRPSIDWIPAAFQVNED
ncbi:MAG: YraN family protein [Oleiphilus sp.]|nr:MAG: YraN family protein [Oleiphilus sp.]